jgi:ABC-type ATPase involved in cell division
MKKAYAFITGQASLPDPFLVELSSHTKMTRRQLQYYEPNVVDCPSEAVPIIRSVLAQNSIVFKKYRLVAKKSILRTILLNDSISEEQVHEEAIMAIIAHEIREALRVQNFDFRTRRCSKQEALILRQWQQTRRKRLKEEQHLMYRTLTPDVERCITELRFVMKSITRAEKC